MIGKGGMPSRGHRCSAAVAVTMPSGLGELRVRGVVLLVVSMLAACVQAVPKKSVTVCDGDGCAQRSLDYSAPASARDAASEEAEQQLAALEQIAEQDPRAAYDLGLRLFRGDGVPRNSYQSLVWMRSAGERGDLEAQKALGRLYLTGLEEMGSDPAEAEKWLLIAASRGDEESRSLLEQATAAKLSEQAWYQWRKRWQPIFYRYWHYDYRYRTYWRNGYWAYY